MDRAVLALRLHRRRADRTRLQDFGGTLLTGRMKRFNLVAARAWAFEQFVLRQHDVTAAITPVPGPVFVSSGHQPEIAALDTIWASRSVNRPKGGSGG